MIEMMDFMVKAERQKGGRILLTVQAKSNPREIYSCKVVRTDAAYIEKDMTAGLSALISDWIRTAVQKKKMPLTPRVKRAYDALVTLWMQNGKAPTLDEVGELAGITRRAGVHFVLNKAVQRGWVYKDVNRTYVPIDIMLGL